MRAGRPVDGLVGYSGGGTVAAILAAGDLKPRWLITLAANLDHARWTQHHGVSPLRSSINPADQPGRLDYLPQLHLVGAEDEQVPDSIVRSYISRLPTGHKAELVVVPEYDHGCCWVRDWPDTLCKSSKTGDPWFATFCLPESR